MARTRIKKETAYPWLALSVAIFFIDQLSKGWVSGHFETSHIDLVQITPFMNLVLAHNPGAAFSFLADAGGWQRWFFIVISVVVSLGIILWLMRMPRQYYWLGASLALILGGALGNLWDRVEFGYVIDFIDVYYQNYHWPAFNVADMAITAGAVSLVLESFFGQRENPSKPVDEHVHLHEVDEQK